MELARFNGIGLLHDRGFFHIYILILIVALFKATCRGPKVSAVPPEAALRVRNPYSTPPL